MQLAPIFEALRRGDWREPHAMADLGAYPVAAGQAPGRLAAQATAELLLLSRMAGGAGAPSSQPLPRRSPSPSPRSGRRSRSAPAAPLQKALERAARADPRRPVRRPLLGSAWSRPRPSTASSPRSGAKPGSYGRRSTSASRRSASTPCSGSPRLPIPPTASDRGLAAAFYADTPVRVPAPTSTSSDTGRPAGTQARPSSAPSSLRF
jgi:hypothetical protein